MDIMELYNAAKNQYAKIGVNTDKAVEELTKLSLSIDCSLSDDEDKRSSHCENVRQLKDDMDSALKLIPGMHRINIGADCYITDDIISIDELEPRHFDEWVSWGKTKVKGIDITSSMRNHEMADTGYTLSSEDKGIRYFWIEHAAACRAIGEKFGIDMISPSFVNIHVYDKLKYSDAAVTDRQKLLKQSLDKIYSNRVDDFYVTDTITGSTDTADDEYQIASELLCHQYARKKYTVPQVAIRSDRDDKSMHELMSNAYYFSNLVGVSISPPANQNLISINNNMNRQFDYLVRNDMLESTQIFINLKLNKSNRKKQWVISTRNVQRAILRALLTPAAVMNKCDEYMKTALTEEFNSFPIGAVWDYFCTINEVPAGIDYLEQLK